MVLTKSKQTTYTKSRN